MKTAAYTTAFGLLAGAALVSPALASDLKNPAANNGQDYGKAERAYVTISQNAQTISPVAGSESSDASSVRVVSAGLAVAGVLAAAAISYV